MEKERRHAFVRVQIEYGFGCFQVRFGLVVSTVWIGSESGFVTLLDESASENHTQNSTRTAPYKHIPFVQMALQTDKTYFRMNSAFQSRYRHRQTCFWNSSLVADTDTAVLYSLKGGRIADQNCFGHKF